MRDAWSPCVVLMRVGPVGAAYGYCGRFLTSRKR